MLIIKAIAELCFSPAPGTKVALSQDLSHFLFCYRFATVYYSHLQIVDNNLERFKLPVLKNRTCLPVFTCLCPPSLINAANSIIRPLAMPVALRTRPFLSLGELMTQSQMELGVIPHPSLEPKHPGAKVTTTAAVPHRDNSAMGCI